MASDQGPLQEGTRSVLWESRNVAVFSDGTVVPPSLASPTNLHCWSAWPGEAELSGMLQPVQYFVHCHTFGTHALWWGGVICTHDLKFWVPFFICITGAQPRLKPHFISIGLNRDNTYLNFIYSLNRWDRQRVAVETKALERWCDMTRSPSRRLREPGIDGGFLTPRPNDLSIGAR